MEAIALASLVENQRFFAALPKNIQAVVVGIFASISDYEKVSAKTVLFNKGDPTADEGILILKGEISVEKEGHPAKQVSGPELVGEMAQLNPAGLRTATVSAVTELELLRFQWYSFRNEITRLLGEDGAETVQRTLESFAWDHFIE